MFVAARVGQRVPAAILAELRQGEPATVDTETLFAGRTAVVMGVPGAFTPVCTEKHLPDFISNADRLKASGLSTLICLAPNDPWVLARWAQEIDPEGKVRFLSDGNLDFCRKLGLAARHESLHLGERSERYTMILKDAVIQRLSVEQSFLDFSCTRSGALML